MSSSKGTAPRRTPRKRTGIWITIIVLLLAGGGAWFYLSSPGAAAISWNPFVKRVVAATPTDYTTTVQRGDIAISASGSGVLVSAQSVNLSFSTSGTVADLNVKLGDQVKAGQVLARLGNSAALQANLASAQLAVLQDQQALNTLTQPQNAQVALAQAFQTVVTDQQKYNDALTADQRTAYARCSKEVNTRNAQVLADATQKLSTLTQFNFGSDLWLSAKSAYDTALANYNYCISYTADEKTNASSALDVAKVNLQQAQQNYNAMQVANGVDPNQLALDQATLNQAQAQLAQAQNELSGITLMAPFDGTVTYLAGAKGSIMDTSTFITISDMSHPTIQVSVDETDLSKLKVGSTVEVTFDAAPEVVLTGKITQVQPELVTSGQVQVAQGLAVIDQTSAKDVQSLPLGANATVTIVDQQVKNALLVPLQALRDLGGGQFGVFVQGPGGQLQLRIVQVGLEDATHAQIISGLNAGDVVSTGSSQVR